MWYQESICPLRVKNGNRIRHAQLTNNFHRRCNGSIGSPANISAHVGDLWTAFPSTQNPSPWILIPEYHITRGINFWGCARDRPGRGQSSVLHRRDNPTDSATWVRDAIASDVQTLSALIVVQTVQSFWVHLLARRDEGEFRDKYDCNISRRLSRV